ncbi:SpoIIE family protein phosphatase [Streptomyces sp. S1A1-8]|uniref:SpoIIE family protein phosphatase n=1 Tax=unclassified Streptomyces TaxID=2593676 RepID=UPI0011650D91|nr:MULTISPECIES: SpoIIE family protein phosphatase [unclassified Streptomyces]QDO25656.1 SpoIIE family protein phosphatase [Streptomyces sp. S1A1-8]QDO35773.1 SpoIIE family protein phosphatase [Streptomyces sp. S1A1-3]
MGASQEVFHTADKLARNALAELADVVAVEVSELMLHDETIRPSPFCTSAPLRRAAFHSAPGAELRPAYAVGEVVRIPAATPYRQSLTDLRPRLIRDLKRDGRWLTRESALARAVRAAQAHSLIVIPLVARGVVLGLVGLYRRADSAPFDAGDLEGATEFADRAARCLDIVHSRIQGRAHARLLQRALLPEVLPSLSALDAAQGHVPADGTGGEWFDIIPLSSARVALVVGAAEGQGAATAVGMSQLRAMIIALAVQDLEPDEILARLDDVVTRLTREHTASGPRPFDLKYGGSRCLCVVYDPVTGRCTSSAAGASRLVILYRDGIVSVPGLASHPPLGADDHRFETTEIDVPPGTVLLLDSGGTDDPCPDTGATAERLHEVVSRSGPDVHEILESVRGVGCPGREPALLAVRPRPLDDKDVARRAFPPDAAAVAAVRTWASRQLAAWRLDELAFATTLVVSELVTNAVRYSSGSIEVRLINDDHTLICEVSDTSSAAPRLRKADPGDEGGRGLSIVTELTQQQGTRHTARGKTVWTEMSHSA